MANVSEVDSKYINREISWLQFNRRVLQEAQDDSTPLLERAKFLSIVSTNLDEFVSVRLAGLMDKIKIGNNEADFTGFTPGQLLAKTIEMIHKLVVDQYKTNEQITRLLDKEGIVFIAYKELTGAQRKGMETYYFQKVFPVLTPLAIDKSRPFPLLRTKSVYFAVVLKHTEDQPDEETHLALVEIPANLPRFVEVQPRTKGTKLNFIMLEDLIKQHIHTLFTMYSPISVQAFRLTRNADLDLNEEETEDLLDELEKVLRTRKWGAPVRIEMEKGFDAFAFEMLRKELEVEDVLLITTDGPVDLSYLMNLSSSVRGFDHLKYPVFTPVYPREFLHSDNVFSVLRKRDVLLFLPYESFDAVNDFIQQAADDPLVLAIKMTLYRVNGNSHVIQALIRAAEAGKQVTVVVELKARFEEARNIGWAKELEKAGCHVVYGLAGLKIHVKMISVVRREDDALRRYIHVSTGNYNEVTAQMFTDIGLFTAVPHIGEDAAVLFNEITGFSVPTHWHILNVAPSNLKQRLFELIRRESDHAAKGKPAKIIAKMNALSNKEMADELYAASRAGVHIDLIVRGICCLRPGMSGLSENITVRSIVDRFLEHSRIFYFENAGDPQVWISSADWMTRNLDRRIELMCPIVEDGYKTLIIKLLLLLLSDNVKARQLLPDGSYTMVKNKQPPCRSQLEAMELVLQKYKLLNTRTSHADAIVAVDNL